MLKVWYVIYMAGQVGGVVGPLPYDRQTCVQQHEIADNLNIQAHIFMNRDVKGNPLSDDAKSISMKCEEHESRPVITYKDGKDVEKVTAQ